MPQCGSHELFFVAALNRAYFKIGLFSEHDFFRWYKLFLVTYNNLKFSQRESPCLNKKSTIELIYVGWNIHYQNLRHAWRSKKWLRETYWKYWLISFQSVMPFLCSYVNWDMRMSLLKPIDRIFGFSSKRFSFKKSNNNLIKNKYNPNASPLPRPDDLTWIFARNRIKIRCYK